MFYKLTRFIMRKHLYAALCLIFLILLIKWNSTHRKQKSSDKKEYDADSNVVVPPPPRLSSDSNFVDERLQHEEKNNIEPKQPASNNEVVDGEAQTSNSVSNSKINEKIVTFAVYMESRCPDTTNFIQRQLLPTFNNLADRVNFVIVPFGKAKCEKLEDEDVVCECQHGEEECKLNQLMNCAIEHLPIAKDHIPIIGCVQGSDSLELAGKACLLNHPESEWLLKCANSKRGRLLHAIAGEQTAKLGAAFNFVPWVVIDGVRVNDAFYALEENLCKRLESPKPKACDSYNV